MECPYPGLRPFTREESFVFFGREEQTDALLKRLDQFRFLAVVGPSGCGKSSLVRAGMIPALETGFMRHAGSRWEFAQMRPGSRPLRRLAGALVAEAGIRPESSDDGEAQAFLTASMSRGPLGLVEVLRETPLPADTNLLILVDQFEEIFRFRREGDADEADAFVSLMLRSTEQREIPIYVVITMRSDFFGDCALFSGLPEAINQSQYLTPRLTRDQRQAAIVGPARVFGADVAPELVNHLLNEMSNDPDQLPLLQHLLMRMWTQQAPGGIGCADAFMLDGAPSLAPSHAPSLLTMDDYRSAGGLADALSAHAEEAYASLTPQQQSIARTMFRRLSERGTDNRDVRRPTRADELATLAGVAVNEVVSVIDVFRAPGSSFLVPPCPEAIYPSTVIDISHESFLRQWGRLRGWIDEEVQSVETYRFLEQSARQWQKGRAALWGTPNLEAALAWREQEKPTADWAQRYGGDYETALQFLTASEEARTREIAAAQQKRKAALTRLRRLAAGFAGISLVMGAGIVWYLYQKVWTYEAYFATFVKKNGLIEGYGRLSEAQRQARPGSLKIVYKGASGRMQYAMWVDAKGACDPRHNIGTVLEFPQPDSPAHKECKWEFVLDAKGDIAYELATNQFGALVWGLVYTPKSLEGDDRRAHFLDDRGQVAPLKNSSAEMIQFSYTPEGYERLHAYLDRDGRPARGLDFAFFRQFSYTHDGLATEMLSLDEQQQPMNDYAGNASLRQKHDSLGNVVEAEAFDQAGDRVTTTTGWHRFVATYDNAGNRTSAAYFNTLGGPATCSDCGAHKIKFTLAKTGAVEAVAYFGTSDEPIAPENLGYHRVEFREFENGNPTIIYYFDPQDRPARDKEGCYIAKLEYNNNGQKTAESCLDASRQPILDNNGVHISRLEYDANSGFIVSISNYGIGGVPVTVRNVGHRRVMDRDKRGNIIQWTYFDQRRRPMTIEDGYHRSTSRFDHLGHEIEESYFSVDGTPALLDGDHHRETLAYDERGHLKEEAYFGVSGEPVRHKGLYHRTESRNDEQGNVLVRSYFGETGALVRGPDGYAVLERNYDRRNQITEWRYRDTDRTSMPNENRCQIERARYDDHDRRVMAACFDSADRPIKNKFGFSKWTEEYDANGRLIDAAYFDENEQLVVVREGTFARRTRQYNKYNQITEEASFGSDGHLRGQDDGCAKKTFDYDDRGNNIAAACFDAQEKLAPYKQGCSRFAWEYDDSGRQKSESCFGADNKPFVGPPGYAKWTKEFDDSGNLLEEAYFDDQGRLTLNKTFSKLVKKYDKSRAVMAAYYGVDNQLIMQPEGYAKWTKEYDAGGNLIEEAYYDDQEMLCLQGEGYARFAQSFDEKGRRVSLAYFGSDDKPRLQKQGYARITTKYDDASRLANARYFDTEGWPVDIEVHITEILPRTPAESLGLRAGDVLVSYNQQPVSDPVRFVSEREAEPADGPAGTLVVRRGAELLSFSVEPGKLGMTLEPRAAASK